MAGYLASPDRLPVEEVGSPGQDALAGAILAFADPAGEIHVPETLPGSCRAVVSIIHGLLASEAALRSGDAGLACSLAEQALEQASALGHVWLEARLLRHLHELTGEKETLERHDAILWRVADGLDRSSERRRLLEAWAPKTS